MTVYVKYIIDILTILCIIILPAINIKVLTMNNSIQEKNENPVVTLKAQAEKFDFRRLRADKNNELAITGKQMYDDFRRMRFVINSKSLDENLIGALIDGVDQNNNFDEVWDRHYKEQEIPGNKKTDQYKEEFERFYNLGKGYTHLLLKKGDKNENYHPIAKKFLRKCLNMLKRKSQAILS